MTTGGVTINQAYPAATSITDSNGNVISTGTSGQYYDTLSASTAAATASPNVNAPTSISWTDVKGNNNDQTVSVTTANVKFQTNFACSGIADVPVTCPQFSFT